MSTRFYSPNPPIDGLYRLEGDEARHLSQVCRLKIGDEVELFDGDGGAIRAKVVELARNAAQLIGIGEPRVEPPSPVPLTLAIAAPKGDRLDWLVEKATELGVSRLVPIRTQRSVVEPRSTKIDRLRRTIVEASKQCGRDRLMVLDDWQPWCQVVEENRDPIRLIAHPGGLAFGDWPSIVDGRCVSLAIGPEGGFAEDEVESAVARGWTPVSLGRQILRIETAGIAGSAAILARVIGNEGPQAVH